MNQETKEVLLVKLQESIAKVSKMTPAASRPYVNDRLRSVRDTIEAEPTTQPPEPTPDPPPATGNRKGTSCAYVLPWESDTDLNRILEFLQSIGCGWIRMDFAWASIQNAGANAWSYGPFDRVVKGAASRGMKIIGDYAYSPSWARSGSTDKYGPVNATERDAFARFCGEATKHFSQLGVKHYELWNEPNIHFWMPSPNPANYTAMVKTAYPQIKAADPEATVITGGLSPAATTGTTISPVDFLKGIYAAGGKGYFDAVGHHPYCFASGTLPGDLGPTKDWSAWKQMAWTNPSLRSVMFDNGDAAKKIWNTESGAPSKDPQWPQCTEDFQAKTVTEAIRLWQSYDFTAGPCSIYMHRDQALADDNREAHFGLVRRDFSLKPAATAYKNA